MSKSKAVVIGFVVLLVNSGWVWAFPEPTLFYVTNVLLHIGLGAVLLAALWLGGGAELARWRRQERPAVGVLTAAGLLGLLLCVIGATRPHLWIVGIHGFLGFLGAALLWRHAAAHHRRLARPLGLALTLALVLPLGSWMRSQWYPRAADRIINPTSAPLSMEQEGGGTGSPFFPSSAVTNTGGLIPSDFFMDSKACAECHQDIYDQWNSSMHHFSSFNNQFYRKAIEYMQETAGVEPSKWCAGCHDHAMFFNGRFERPAKGQLDTPQAHAGLGCMSCHSITQVPDTMGNGGFVMTYPPLHDLLVSDNAVIRFLHNYVTNVAPAAHRRAFLKPFMREQRSEFCATCHKVHLDVPVNNYRWFRGFNEYDSWQASGVSGEGARSFYYPAQPSDCVDCHMPLVEGKDPAAINGMVHSHRFPAANTAVPYVNQDDEQLQATLDFLQDNIVSVDIFAVTPVEEDDRQAAMRRRSEEVPQALSGFAVGEEAESGPRAVLLREVGRIAAPLDRTRPPVQPGDIVKVDVVVRTRKVGHFFPGGTVDAFDVWLELKALDADGRVIFWSGRVEEDGKGAVEKGAHFYRSFMLDGHGNPIDKRNAFHARSVLYVRLIPPGAADVAHFRVKIPADAKGPIRFTAQLNYRKFSHYYTQFSYAGEPASDDAPEYGKDFDDRRFTFSPRHIPQNVPGRIKDRIPDLPIVRLAEAEAPLALGTSDASWDPKVEAKDYERWNDYGIGLLLQGDLKGAEYAFQRVTKAAPDFADGWLNVARALVEEGQTDKARPYVEKALELDPSLGRIHFFRAMVQKAEGDYEGALASLQRVEEQYPKDRVVLNQIARILFLQREFEQAIGVLERVARIDPEDLQMHYTLMLCYRGLGDTQKAEREEQLFRRFKADEASQTITARIRRQSPEDNNERQMIHEHVSVALSPRLPISAASRAAAAGGSP